MLKIPQTFTLPSRHSPLSEGLEDTVTKAPLRLTISLRDPAANLIKLEKPGFSLVRLSSTD